MLFVAISYPKQAIYLLAFLLFASTYTAFCQGISPNKKQMETIRLCEKDTLYMLMILEDSSLQEIVYQWQAKERQTDDWKDMEDANNSYLSQFPIQEGTQYRCKAAYSDSCLLNPDCEGFVQYFQAQIAPKPRINYDISPATCEKKNAALQIKITGENNPYSLRWNNSSREKNLSNIPSGMYHVVLRDVWGCTYKDSVFVPLNSRLPNFRIQVTPATCGAKSGEIHVLNPNNQYLTYSWNTGQVTQSLEHLSVGKYELQVKNEWGCIKDTIITISHTSLPMAFSIEKEDANCTKANGKISIKMQGTEHPYRYLWNTGDTLSSISGLGAGVYFVKITDKRGCIEESGKIEIQGLNIFKPRLKVQNISCAGKQDGKIEAKIMGGDSLFLFAWSNGAVGSKIENLPAGTYELSLLMKETGCVSTSKAEITAPNPIEITATDIPDSLSYALKINAIGGKAPYIYALNAEDNYQPFSIFDSLSQGDYHVFVQDANACTQDINYTIAPSILTDDNLPPVFISNIISPNGDGKFDEFSIKSPQLADAYIEIFNAQGDLIFENMMRQSTWRGSANATFCLPGIYYYFVELQYENGLTRDMKGSVRLIR